MIEASSVYNLNTEQIILNNTPTEQEHNQGYIFQKTVDLIYSHNRVVVNNDFFFDDMYQEQNKENIKTLSSINIEIVECFSKGIKVNFNRTIDSIGTNILAEQQELLELDLELNKLYYQRKEEDNQQAKLEITKEIFTVKQRYSELSEYIAMIEAINSLFSCRHITLLVIFFGLVHFENIEEFIKFLCFQSIKDNISKLSYQESFNMLENYYTKIDLGISAVVEDHINNNATVQDLIELKCFLNPQQHDKTINYIDNTLQTLVATGYNNLNEKLANISKQIYNELLKLFEFEIEYLFLFDLFFKSKYPLNKKFFTYEQVFGYVSSCSVNSFSDFLYGECNNVFYNSINYTENFLIFTKSHTLALQIKNKQYGIVIKLYDSNDTARTKNVYSVSMNHVKKISILKFISESNLYKYDIIIGNNFNLCTIDFIQLRSEFLIDYLDYKTTDYEPMHYE